ncbi:transmembrane 7 superfamily member 3-like [Rhodnius prolixus]
MFLWLLLLFMFQADAIETDDNLIEDGGIVMLSLKNYTIEYASKQVTLPANASITIQVTEISNNVSFIVLQVHTFLYPVTLKYTNDITNNNNVNGTNIGLVKFTKLKSTLIFYLRSFHNWKIHALIAAVGYTDKSPVPGGCALASPTEMAPYLDINYTDSIISVNGGPSSYNSTTYCNKTSGVKYTFYHTFVPEWDFTEETYFTSILNMMTYDSVIYRSLVALEAPTGPILQRLFSSYPGIGRVFTIVATAPSGAVSVYVPTFTYSCNITINTDSCGLPMTTFVKVENALLAFVGLFICFKGHRYYHTNLFVMGSVTGTFVSYVLLTKFLPTEVDFIMIATVIGMVFGVIWTSTWWCLHSPILSVVIPLLNCCCLITAILYSIIRDLLPVFESDINYWITFFSVSLMFLFLSLPRPLSSNISACCVIGAFMTIVPIAISVGSSIAYVFINVIRRATVKGFNLANTEFPTQVPDTVLWLFAILLIWLGRWRQMAQAKNRPPFPPTPVVLRRDDPEERVNRDVHDENTSLMADANYPNYTLASESTTAG